MSDEQIEPVRPAEEKEVAHTTDAILTKTVKFLRGRMDGVSEVSGTLETFPSDVGKTIAARFSQSPTLGLVIEFHMDGDNGEIIAYGREDPMELLHWDIEATAHEHGVTIKETADELARFVEKWLGKRPA